MNQLSVFDMDGKESEKIDLPKDIFGEKVNSDVLHQAIVMYQASLRQGNANTLRRAEVSGGGKKPWRQKGTGRARAGSIRSPLWHKGGIIFGPHPRDFGYSIPKKIKTAALRESLNAKFQDKDLLCLIDLKKELNKTKDFAQILKKIGVKGKVLAILDGSDNSIERVSRNIDQLSLMRAQDVNAYDILRNKKLLVTKTAFKSLISRAKQ